MMRTTSPFPESFQGDPLLFGGALFGLILMTMFALMLGSVFARQLWCDRKEGWSLANIVCSIFLTICAAMTIRCAPDAVWMINFADMSVESRIKVANVKRFLDAFALIPVGIWMSTVIIYKNEILLRLKSPTLRYWNDHPFTPLVRVLPLVGMCFAFASFVTIGLVFQ